MWSTKLKKSNISTNEIHWNSSLLALTGKQSQKTIDKLNDAGIITLFDLLWIFPLRIIELPPIRSFKEVEDQGIFIGRARILNIQARPNFYRKGKGKALLYNLQVFVQDLLSDEVCTLKWFNAYGSIKEKISKAQTIEFLGTASNYNGKLQFVNPEFAPIIGSEIDGHFLKLNNELKIQYPTINSIPGTNIKKIFDKIPTPLWDEINETLPSKIISDRHFISLSLAFKFLHGKVKPNTHLETETEKRLIYEEFFEGQLKFYLRRQFFKKSKSHFINITTDSFKNIISTFPHAFTVDQTNALADIIEDYSKETPMMRLIQGDVGCGKTWVAFASALIAISNGFQVAMMCPTEALATQHFHEAGRLFPNISSSLLLSATRTKDKNKIYEALQNGETSFIIGTHSLIQDKVQFKNLGLVIIDEQHKFGVDQRIKLFKKAPAAHCLIMSATPIPRSLSLTRFGDLDISTIKSMPSGRRGFKTRIIKSENYQQYLSFIKTRLLMKEQVYIVVPAINDNPDLEINNLNSVLLQYKKYFPEFIVSGLHGQLKSEEKSVIFMQFSEGKIDLLVSTSVIEVGINVPNATVISILNPERFGLSSLHQLRGRVGRGEKPGFCFLVNDKEISAQSHERLKVIEKNTDGFIIAEEDLRLRGEGDLFGKEQSGSIATNRFANLSLHAHILEDARRDALNLIHEKNPEVLKLLENFSKDDRIFTTA